MVTCHKIILLLYGITNIYGYDNLSKGKSASISPMYGMCLHCDPKYVVDDVRETCARTDSVGGASSFKTTWWIVDLGGNVSIYSISILFQTYDEKYEMRQRGRFAGFSLYISNTPNKEDGILCYKNTLPLPPLEFNITCIGYGRYIIYYNERLDGVTYPEGYQHTIYTQLCEVKVEGCAEAGVYGESCSLPCPMNCHDNKCNMVNGTCLSCDQGWTGDKCTEKCPLGWYGLACKNQCVGHCRESRTCHHVTGYCEDGCADGWMGKLCDKPCKAGSYGPGCVQNCSGHCLNNNYCNRESGHCDNGCSPGYSGDLCNKPCPRGLFGISCQKQCSKTCIDENCVYTSGACIYGCVDGFFGIKCSNACIEGYFGTNCSSVCPPNCNYTCHHIDGSCSHAEKESTYPLVVVISITIVGTIICILIVAVSIAHLRQNSFKNCRKKIKHPLSTSDKQTNEGHAETDKTYYEELDGFENKNQYQELSMKAKNVNYENLF